MTGPLRRQGTGATAQAVACPSCGARAIAGLPYCPSCGKRLMQPATERACARCGTEAPEGTKYCPSCGLGLQGGIRPSAAAVVPPSKYVISVLDESATVMNQFSLKSGETTIGREGADVAFADDPFMSPLHVKVTVRGDEISARDLGSRNGTWFFIAEPYRLVDGDRLLVGSQVYLYRRLGYPGPHPPERDATRRLGSLVPSADIARLTQLRSDGSERDAIHLSPGRDVSIGREQGDWVFPYDPSMSSRHAVIQSEDADFILVDAGSRNGVAVSIRGDVELRPSARMLVGDKMLRIDPA